MKWMLIHYDGLKREIKRPRFFDSHEKAYKAMCEEFAKTVGIPFSDTMEIHLYGKHTYFEISDNYAWCNDNDWTIFDISKKEVE